MRRFACRLPLCLGLMFVFAFSSLVASAQDTCVKTKPAGQDKTAVKAKTKLPAPRFARSIAQRSTICVLFGEIPIRRFSKKTQRKNNCSGNLSLKKESSNEKQ